jgi:hypothetical protein
MSLELRTLADLIRDLECDPLRYPLRSRLALYRAGAWRPGQPFRPFSKAFAKPLIGSFWEAA